MEASRMRFEQRCAGNHKCARAIALARIPLAFAF